MGNLPDVGLNPGGHFPRSHAWRTSRTMSRCYPCPSLPRACLLAGNREHKSPTTGLIEESEFLIYLETCKKSSCKLKGNWPSCWVGRPTFLQSRCCASPSSGYFFYDSRPQGSSAPPRGSVGNLWELLVVMSTGWWPGVIDIPAKQKMFLISPDFSKKLLPKTTT